MEKQIGTTIERVIADAGYKGHNAPAAHRFEIYTAGQKRGMTEKIKREMRRRSAIEPVIGHMKDDHRMGRNDLAGPAGDAINPVLAAVGYDFRRLLAWRGLLLAAFWCRLGRKHRRDHALARSAIFTDDQVRDDTACPQAEVQAILAWILAVHPVEYLLLLTRLELRGRPVARLARNASTPISWLDTALIHLWCVAR